MKGLGIITLMGSGELSVSMVEVHKFLLNRYGVTPRSVFIDTPAGFQLNVDHVAEKAIDYFKTRLGKPLTLASLKSVDDSDLLEIEETYDTIRKSDYILIGPGSPTYALGQWQRSPIPDLFVRHIQKGGCIVAASAAALTLGCWTLPVYEIYKVGQSPHWVKGLNVLHSFGLNWVVLPHWNNAEGGNHDTRYCFMGAKRFGSLFDMVAPTADIVGLDEHTALVVDLAQDLAYVRGIGQVTVRRREREWVYDSGAQVPLSLLRGEGGSVFSAPTVPNERFQTAVETVDTQDPVWGSIHDFEKIFQDHLDRRDMEKAIRTLLALEHHIWNVQQELLEQDALGAVREVFRELLVSLSVYLTPDSTHPEARFALLVEDLLALRDRLRKEKQWAAADALRECLLQAHIRIEDTTSGASWHLAEPSESN